MIRGIKYDKYHIIMYSDTYDIFLLYFELYINFWSINKKNVFYIRMCVLREVCSTEILKGPTGKASDALPGP
jgi:hypothetical protein